MAKKSAKQTPPTSDVDATATATSASTSATTTTTTTTSSTTTVSKRSSAAPSGNVIAAIWHGYVNDTPARVKLMDVFMAYLVGVGVVQFVYCVIAGNYPFNAFLSGFCATVGQFVLTASLRIQTNPANKAEFTQVSPERAFADFIFGSLILHFFCVNFIN